MTCKGCHSDNQSTFNGELAIHFPGRNGLDKPIVWVFPKLAVCLHCGFTELTVPERELTVLVTGTPVEGAVVLAGSGSSTFGKSQDSLSAGMND
jgi:hypothetical protein